MENIYDVKSLVYCFPPHGRIFSGLESQVPADRLHLLPSGQQCLMSEQHTAFAKGQHP